MPDARESDPRNHRSDPHESVQVAPNYVANLSQGAHGQRAGNKGQFRTQARGFLHIGEYLYLSPVDEVALPPEVAPRCSSGWHEVIHGSPRLIKYDVLRMRYPVGHVHVIFMI
jgi:hypothetical protein